MRRGPSISIRSGIHDGPAAGILRTHFVKIHTGIDHPGISCHIRREMFSVARLRVKVRAAMIWQLALAHGA